MLAVRDVDSGYNLLQVLREVSLSIEEGEFVALLGPNGAGKSTTLKTIAGLVRGWSGEIVFRDEPIGDLPAHRVARLGIALVSEDLNLFTGMSVHENLLVGALRNGDRGGRRDALDRVFTLFPRLAERRRQLAGTLSGGERKMLALGRALMGEPALLLVDEPSLGLAPKITNTVFAALAALHAEGRTILLVEQNVPRTLQLVDRAYVLEQGRIVLEGPATMLADNPHLQQVYMGAAG
ncbi:MAG: branched-chain amino acid transport system ATP-binding protein [Thermoleophilaceae bacterium]|jgi:ABC-type branched-subunit amino acid transport system ATPase component|nr:branched-chain amino acid transport system ATP-binding protein [Thermoleophilaceae bacterium]MEA2407187.1 branched-chain amino acid transport system ATP-binding protein [Thermoleophilaceae bacterium]